MQRVNNEKDLMVKFSELGPKISSKYDWEKSAKFIQELVTD